MPRYSCKQVLREKLKYAIHFCKSIDTDDYARIALTGDPLEEQTSEEEEEESSLGSVSGGHSEEEEGQVATDSDFE